MALCLALLCPGDRSPIPRGPLCIVIVIRYSNISISSTLIKNNYATKHRGDRQDKNMLTNDRQNRLFVSLQLNWKKKLKNKFIIPRVWIQENMEILTDDLLKMSEVWCGIILE